MIVPQDLIDVFIKLNDIRIQLPVACYISVSINNDTGSDELFLNVIHNNKSFQISCRINDLIGKCSDLSYIQREIDKLILDVIEYSGGLK